VELIRWNPAYDLLNVHSELDQVFDRMLQGWGFTPRYSDRTGQGFLPVDIHRAADSVVIEASVPGFKPEDVSVTVEGNVLTIQAERDESSEAAEKEYVRKERHVGGFYRQIALGDEVEGEKALADFKDGVLTVKVPLVAKPEPKRIPITVEARK